MNRPLLIAFSVFSDFNVHCAILDIFLSNKYFIFGVVLGTKGIRTYKHTVDNLLHIIKHLQYTVY